jgi:hypothetical protein
MPGQATNFSRARIFVRREWTSISFKAICCFALQSQFFDLGVSQASAAAENVRRAGFGNPIVFLIRAAGQLNRESR